jgi:hypothetical protein
MTHRQALQGFPDTSQVSLHENNKIVLPFLQQWFKVWFGLCPYGVNSSVEMW